MTEDVDKYVWLFKTYQMLMLFQRGSLNCWKEEY